METTTRILSFFITTLVIFFIVLQIASAEARPGAFRNTTEISMPKKSDLKSAQRELAKMQRSLMRKNKVKLKKMKY